MHLQKAITWQFFVFAIEYVYQVAAADEVPELNITTRIINGKEVRRGEFPFVVQIMINGSFACGGSIINENWILTAAHCYVTPLETTTYTVVAGEHDTRVNEGSEQSRKVTRIIIHPNFETKIVQLLPAVATEIPYNDVALWKVSESFTFNQYVQPAILARKQKSEKTFSNTAVVAGWGKQNYYHDFPSQVLMKVTVPIFPTSTCSLKYLPTSIKIRPGIICAGTIGRSECKGDSGGPLVKNNKVIGVVSFSLFCATVIPSGY